MRHIYLFNLYYDCYFLYTKLIYKVINLKQFISVYRQASMRYGVKCDNSVWQRYRALSTFCRPNFQLLHPSIGGCCICVCMSYPEHRAKGAAKNKTRTILKHNEVITIRRHYYTLALFSIMDFQNSAGL